MDAGSDPAYALDYSESMAFFNSAYNATSAQAITATEFDIAQELLWAGTNEVRSTSFVICNRTRTNVFRDEWHRSPVVICANTRAFVSRAHRMYAVFSR
jgi:hypothetical protein